MVLSDPLERENLCSSVLRRESKSGRVESER